MFIRSFILFFLTTVLCPSTYDYVNAKYLFSLRDSDIPEVGILDFASLCLDHLWKEIDAWKNRCIANRGEGHLSWVGSCLPLLAVVYLDFLNFNGYVVHIDYSLPRMSFIRNEDFVHVLNFDRDITSAKSYGVLPMRDISLTPYGMPLAILPASPQLPPSPEAVNDFVAQSPPLPVSGDNLVGDVFPEIGDNYQESPMDISDPQDEVDSLGSYNIEHVVSSGTLTPDASAENMDANKCTNEIVDSDEDPSRFHLVADGLMKIAISYADHSNSYPAQEIGEGFVSISPTPTNGLRNKDHVSVDIGDCLTRDDATCVAHDIHAPAIDEGLSTQDLSKTMGDSMPRPNTVLSSFERKNRKRRAAKTTSPECYMQKFQIDSYIEAFYDMFIRKKQFNSENSPIVIEIGPHTVSYEDFFSIHSNLVGMSIMTQCLFLLGFLMIKLYMRPYPNLS